MDKLIRTLLSLEIQSFMATLLSIQVESKQSSQRESSFA